MTEQLIKFAREGNLEGVRTLIKDGVDINYQDGFGKTALMWASYWKHTEAVKFLIEKGANLDLQDKCGWSALRWASYMGRFEIIKLLVENGANLNLQDENGKTALDIAKERLNLLVKYNLTTKQNRQKILELLTTKN